MSADDDTPEIEEQLEEAVLNESQHWVRGQYDFCIIHSERDVDEVITFRDDFCKKHNLEGILESDPEMMKVSSWFDRLKEMVKRSTKVLMYMTDNFIDDSLCNLQKNELLSRHIRDPHNCSNIIPLYTKDFDKAVQDFPFGLCGMFGIKLYTPNGDFKRINNTFNPNVRKAKTIREALENKNWEQRLVRLRIKIGNDLRTQHQNGVLQVLTEQVRTERGASCDSGFVDVESDGNMRRRNGCSTRFASAELERTRFASAELERTRFASAELERIGNGGDVADFSESLYNTTVQKVEQCQIGPVYNINLGENAHLVLHTNNRIVTSVNNAQQVVSYTSKP